MNTENRTSASWPYLLSLAVIIVIALALYLEVSGQSYAIEAVNNKHRREVAELSAKISVLEERLLELKQVSCPGNPS